MSRIGIALAGGGPLGGIYEVGACTALEEAIDGLTMTRAECFVGVSSGSFIASALANGISPEKLAHILLDDDDATVFDPNVLLRPAFREYYSRLLSLPQLAGSSALTWLRDPLHQGLFESFQQLSHAIPTGLFDNRGIDLLLRRLFTGRGRTNDFRKLRGQLFLIATSLDSGESVAFGSAGHDEVPISTAVQASAALPGLFPPVEINGRHYVDGALIKTLHASVALQAGTDLLFCINPLVPFDAELAARRRHATHPRHLNDGGLPVVLSQTFRAIIHSRMRVGMKRYRHQFPSADVLLFEPTQDDGEMFFTNVFSYRDRRHLCEHAYQRTRQDLYRRRHELIPVLRRHGLTLDLAVLKDHRRSLLERPSAGPTSPMTLTTQALEHALDELQSWLSMHDNAG